MGSTRGPRVALRVREVVLVRVGLRPGVLGGLSLRLFRLRMRGPGARLRLLGVPGIGGRVGTGAVALTVVPGCVGGVHAYTVLCTRRELQRTRYRSAQREMGA